jgi:hypothetical protein
MRSLNYAYKLHLPIIYGKFITIINLSGGPSSMSFIAMHRSIFLSLLITNIAQAVDTLTPTNTALFAQGYNTVYTNDPLRIARKSLTFAARNPSLLLLLTKPTFVATLCTLLRQGAKLSAYYPLLDAYDESERIKIFAQQMLVEAKIAIEDGIKALQALLDAGYTVVILMGQDASFNEEFKKAFPILAHERVVIINNFDNYDASIEGYTALKEASGKEYAILLYGNRNHASVDNAEAAGLIIKHYSQAIEA